MSERYPGIQEPVTDSCGDCGRFGDAEHYTDGCPSCSRSRWMKADSCACRAFSKIPQPPTPATVGLDDGKAGV